MPAVKAEPEGRCPEFESEDDYTYSQIRENLNYYTQATAQPTIGDSSEDTRRRTKRLRCATS
eukprot:15157214-Alexandrium_andersonii.AAC.1